MHGGGANEEGSIRAAEVLQECSSEIFAEYRTRLEAMKSPLISDSRTREQLEAQARSVLEEAAAKLGGERIASEVCEDQLSEEVGLSRARERIHPSESLRAVSALSGAALSVVTRVLPPSPMSAGEVAKIAQVLHECAMERVSRASVSYVDYLLREIHRSSVHERRRIDDELREQVANSLAVVCRSLELYDVFKAADPDEARNRLELASRVAQEAMTSVVDLSAELAAAEAPEGIEVALTDFMSTAVPPEISSWVSVVSEEVDIPPHVRDELYLILREAIRNVVRHSGAKEIRVELRTTLDNVTGLIEDDGNGFYQRAPNPMTSASLEAMEARAHLLGGTLQVSSTDKGNRAEIRVPLARR